MGVTGGEPLGFNVGAQGPGGTLPGLDLVRLNVTTDTIHSRSHMKFDLLHAYRKVTQTLPCLCQECMQMRMQSMQSALVKQA